MTTPTQRTALGATYALAGMDFFASMTASMSHELKNVFAIVNENAGLLDDLLLLAAKGRPLNTERLQTLAANINRQVRRGDELLRRLHALAHSAKDPVAVTPLAQIFEALVALTARLAAMKKVRVLGAAEGHLQLRVHAFSLLNSLWLVLKHFLQQLPTNTEGDEHAVTLSGREQDAENLLIEIRVDYPWQPPVEGEMEPALAALANSLRMKLYYDADTQVFGCLLPKG